VLPFPDFGMPQGVIFDVDGVLVDSYRAHFRSWELLAADLGLTYTEADFAAGFGRTSREILSEQWSRRIPGLTAERIRELDAKKELHYRQIIADDFPAMDGARELVAALADSGFRIAVGSSGPPENVDLVIDRLGIAPRLTGRVTAADVTRGKPAGVPRRGR
jgi:beta-phosphoglucomutase